LLAPYRPRRRFHRLRGAFPAGRVSRRYGAWRAARRSRGADRGLAGPSAVSRSPGTGRARWGGGGRSCLRGPLSLPSPRSRRLRVP